MRTVVAGVLTVACTIGCRQVAGIDEYVEEDNRPFDGEHARPPAPVPGAPPGDGPGHVYAISRLYLGDTDRSGVVSDTAWRHYGFDLDGLDSQVDFDDLCQPQGGADASWVHVDGHAGIDNNFGKILLPMLLGLASDAAAQMNQMLRAGQFGILIEVTNLGAQPSYLDLRGVLYLGGVHSSPPQWRVDEYFPIADESLISSSLGAPRWQFPVSYLTEHVFVTAPPQALPMGLGGSWLGRIFLEQAVAVMTLSDDRTAATSGTIAGVVPTEVFVEALRDELGAWGQPCSGATFDALAQTIRQASDVRLAAGDDPAQPCDGISFAVGFDAIRVHVGVVSPPAQSTDPCP